MFLVILVLLPVHSLQQREPRPEGPPAPGGGEGEPGQVDEPERVGRVDEALGPHVRRAGVSARYPLR